MWICLNNAFLSIVCPRQRDIPKAERGLTDPLMIRARKADHLRAAFPNARIYEWANRDYPARVFVARNEVMGRIAAAVHELDYDNFKNSVRDDELHDAYSAVWGVMNRYQRGGFAPKRKPAMRSFWDDLADTPDPEDDPLLDDAPMLDVCWQNGCNSDHPCRDCIERAVREMEAGKQPDSIDGDDDGEDGPEPQSHLRVAPK